MFSDNKKNKTLKNTVREQNKISQGTTLTGDIQSKGGFRIEGKLLGNLTTENKVVIGQTGYVEGEITCVNADIEGKFTGKLTVKETLTLKSTAQVEGEVATGKLSVEPDATFNATCVMKGAVKSLSDDRRGKKQKEEERTA